MSEDQLKYIEQVQRLVSQTKGKYYLKWSV